MAHRKYEQRQSGQSAGRKAIAGCGFVVLMLILGLAYRWTSGSANPILTFPPKIAPSPNAYDTYRSAGRMLINSNQIKDARDPKNGYTLAQEEKLVVSNTQALQTLRSGFSQEYLDTSARSPNTILPYLAQYRTMAWLLRLEDRVKAQKKDWMGAVDSDLDCLRMGEDIPHGAPLVGDLVGNACQAIGRRDLWEYVVHLDAAQSRKAIARLQTILDHHYAFSDALTEEKYFGMGTLQELFRDNKNLRDALYVVSDASPGEDNGGPPPIVCSLFYVAYSKNRIAQSYINHMDHTIANARQPYTAHLPDPPVPNDPINQALSPVYSEARFRDVESQTQNGLLVVTLAIHAYRVEHGHYPQSLQELAPAYLKQLPLDPFALKGTFQYHPKGATYLLYSLGPDGKDDGGTAMVDPSKATSPNPDALYFVKKDSIGDIIAGKNF